MAKTKPELPETAEEYEKSLREKVMVKMQAGEQLTAKDTMILNGYVEMYDPAIQAYKQVAIKDYFAFLKSLEANK